MKENNEKEVRKKIPLEYKAGPTDSLAAVLILMWWMIGIVISEGFTQSLIAVMFPPYAWYIATEFLMRVAGLLETSI